MSGDENRAKPVVFLAFANEQEGQRYLRDLPEESRQLQSILPGAKDRNLCELEVRTNVTLFEIDEADPLTSQFRLERSQWACCLLQSAGVVMLSCGWAAFSRR